MAGPRSLRRPARTSKAISAMRRNIIYPPLERGGTLPNQLEALILAAPNCRPDSSPVPLSPLAGSDENICHISFLALCSSRARAILLARVSAIRMRTGVGRAFFLAISVGQNRLAGHSGSHPASMLRWG